MKKSERHAVTVFLKNKHLRKMIDDYPLKEDEIDDQVKVARVMQKRLDSALGFPEKPWHDWDEWDLSDCYFLTGRAKPMLGHSQPQ
jgi:hypothetical protein